MNSRDLWDLLLFQEVFLSVTFSASVSVDERDSLGPTTRKRNSFFAVFQTESRTSRMMICSPSQYLRSQGSFFGEISVLENFQENTKLLLSGSYEFSPVRLIAQVRT